MENWMTMIDIGLIPILKNYDAPTKEICSKLDALISDVSQKYDKEPSEVKAEITRLAKASIHFHSFGINEAIEMHPKFDGYRYFLEYAKEELYREKQVLDIICEWAKKPYEVENERKRYNKHGRPKESLRLCPDINIDDLKKSVNSTITNYKSKCKNEAHFLGMLIVSCFELSYIYSDGATPCSFLRDLDIENHFGASVAQNATRVLERGKNSIKYNDEKELDLKDEIRNYLETMMSNKSNYKEV